MQEQKQYHLQDAEDEEARCARQRLEPSPNTTLSPVKRWIRAFLDEGKQDGQNAQHFTGKEQLDVDELEQQYQPVAIHGGQQNICARLVLIET